MKKRPNVASDAHSSTLTPNGAGDLAARITQLERELDVSQSRNRELEQLAFFDATTGLPNRQWLIHELEKRLNTSAWRDLNLLYVSIDRLIQLDEKANHPAAQTILKLVAQRLAAELPEGLIATCVGANEFVILCQPGRATPAKSSVFDQVTSLLEGPFPCGEQMMALSLRYGQSTFATQNSSTEELLESAYTAAESRHEPLARAPSPTAIWHTKAIRKNPPLERELRTALHNDNLSLYYQPQIDLLTGRMAGVEALLRWQHPTRGLLTAAPLIKIAEQSDLIQNIGEWALRAACAQLQAWSSPVWSSLTIAVNLSAHQFLRKNLIEQVKSALNDYSVDPRRLKLELTESVLVNDVRYASNVLNQLNAMGVRIAIDDFGVGYSSLNYLKHFPLDSLKIDRSFVTHLTTEPADAAIVTSVITLAHGMNLQVIAEGVETEEQLAYLQSKNCDSIQGFYFSPAVPANTLLATGLFERPQHAPNKTDPTPTILVVDDDEAMRAYFAAVLESAGYAVTTANDADGGFAQLARHPFELVLADYKMPRTTGTDFLRRVRTLHPDTVRVLISAHAHIEALTDAINDGAIFKFLTKPVDEQELQETARLALRHRRQASSAT